MSVIRANQWELTTGVPVNSVIQLVRSTNVTSLLASGLNVRRDVGSLVITPRFANSAILILATMTIQNTGGSLNSSICFNSINTEIFRFNENNVAGRFGHSGSVIHFPGTTSPCTYFMGWLKESGDSASNGSINGNIGNSLMALEIRQ
jgi:hypothetical protein